jgi:hypothetical protein
MSAESIKRHQPPMVRKGATGSAVAFNSDRAGPATASSAERADMASAAAALPARHESGLQEKVVAKVGGFVVSEVTVTSQRDHSDGPALVPSVSSPPPSADAATGLTDEQVERMRANRERAQARLESRKRAAEPP